MGNDRTMHMRGLGIAQHFDKPNLWKAFEGFLVVLACDLLRLQHQDSTGRSIKCCDNTSRVRGNHAISNRFKDVVHVLLIFSDLTHGFIEVSEEASIVNGDGRLIAESQQEFKMPGIKQISIHPAINVYGSNTVITNDQGGAHDRAYTIGHDALLPF